MRTLWATSLLLLLLIPAPFESVRGAPPRQMELVSRLGRKPRVKIYSGEVLAFRAREVRDGVSGIFTSGASLSGVTFTLRAWPRVTQNAAAIVKGVNRSLVREKKPAPDLWGRPPSFFRVEDEKPGRYILTAKKPGFAAATVIVECATLNLHVNDGELSLRHYTANFDVELIDPGERGRPIPIRVETLNEDGAVVDERDDLRLVVVTGKGAVYRTNVPVNLSSRVIESFAERLKRRKKAPLPPLYFATKPMRIKEGGSLRISVRNLRVVYPIPLGY